MFEDLLGYVAALAFFATILHMFHVWGHVKRALEWLLRQIQARFES